MDTLTRLFNANAWAAPILDPKTYGIPNGGMYARGDRFYQLYNDLLYPSLKSFYFQFERDYNPEPVLNMMKNNQYYLPVGAIICYITFVFFIGPSIMKSREAFKLKYETASWNLFLSLFSFYGASRTVPWLIYRLMNK